MMPEIKKQVDFFALVRAESVFVRRKFGLTPLIMLCAAVAAVILVLWGIFTVLEKNATQELSSIGTAITGISGPSETAGPAVADIFAVRQRCENDPALTTTVLRAIFAAQPSDLQIMDVMYSSRTITLHCWSERELCGADFARLLRDSPEFSSIGYAGVTASDGGYSFTVTATIPDKGAVIDAN